MVVLLHKELVYDWNKGWVAYEFREGEAGMEAFCILATNGTNGAQISEH